MRRVEYNLFTGQNIIIRFIVSTFIFTYIFWITQLVLATLDIIKPNSTIYILLQSFRALGPTIFSIIYSRRTYSNISLKYFFKQWIPNRPNFWVILVICIQILIELIKSMLRVKFRFSGNPVVSNWLIMISIFPLMMLGGGIEEPGWRGVIYKHSLGLNKAKLSAILTFSIVWITWHLPLWLIPGTLQHEKLDFSVWAINTITLSVILFTIRMLGGSIGWCIISHSISNTLLNVFPLSKSLFYERMQSFICFAFIVLAFIFLKHQENSMRGADRRILIIRKVDEFEQIRTT